MASASTVAKYSLHSKISVADLSRFACIYTQKSVYIHANLDRYATLILERRKYEVTSLKDINIQLALNIKRRYCVPAYGTKHGNF
jgi:hypothetical protein